MNKKIVFIDMNPASEQIPIYQLGLCFLGGIALKKGWNIHIIEYCELVEKGIESFKEGFDRADCISISIRNIDNTEGSNPLSYLEMIKKDMLYLSLHYSDKSVLGGAGFSILPYEILHLFHLKYGIVGRSGKIFDEMLEWIEKREDLEAFFPESIRRNKGQCDIYQYEKLENIWRVIPYIENAQKMLGFDTHIGCGGQCVYCTYPQITKEQNSRRSIDEICKFISEADKKRFLHLQIVDDIFNSDLEYAKNVCRGIAETGHSMEISCYLSPNVDSELARLLKKAGIHEVIMGIDSLADAVLKKMKKGFNVKEIYGARKLLGEAGISVVYTFIIGSIFETADTLKETEENILIHMPDRVTLQYGVRIYPGTALSHSLRLNRESFYMPVFGYSNALPRESIVQFIEKIKKTTAERKML